MQKDTNDVPVMGMKAFGQTLNQSYCVGQAAVSMVQMLGDPLIPGPRPAVISNEESDTNPSEYIGNYAAYNHDINEQQPSSKILTI